MPALGRAPRAITPHRCRRHHHHDDGHDHDDSTVLPASVCRYVEAITPAADLGHVPRAELAKLLPMPDLSAYESKGNLFAAIIPVEVAAAMAGVEDKLTAAVADAKEVGARVVVIAIGSRAILLLSRPSLLCPCAPSACCCCCCRCCHHGGAAAGV